MSIGAPPVALVTLPLEALGRHSDAVDLSQLAGQSAIGPIFATDVNAPETLERLRAAAPDLILVVGWSQICRAEFRSVARLGCIGFHPSALPRLRGRAVIPWTILTRQETAGSTFFWLDDGVDTGDIIAQCVFPLDEQETARTLYDKHLKSIADLLPEVLSQLTQQNPRRIAQDDSKASYCARRGPEDGMIDWHASADDVLRLIRAVGDPYPGAFTRYHQSHIRLDEARLYDGGTRFIGLPGQIQTYAPGGPVVLCGDDRCVQISRWDCDGAQKPPKHAVLGRS
ncbi:methionyl-tRNA formyltransferase [Rhizobium sp. TRM95111]|nr:methionyl-tRNA formyltransferase [Rhizobium alarense]MCF3641816.1 methionyl-tRNA formyltransferase [Rhizobium alarense]